MVTVSFTLAQTGQIYSYDVAPATTLGEIKEFIAAEGGIAKETQVFFFNGHQLQDDAQTVETAGIKDGDMLAVVVRQQNQQQRQQHQQQQGLQNASPQDAEIEQARQDLLRNAEERERLVRSFPELGNAVNDPVAWRRAYLEADRKRREIMAVREAEDRDLDENITEENQAKIMERIRKQAIDEEVEKAMRDHPEFFAQVTMLYVDVEVNGRPLKAFVDSGAQSTIMSSECAEACGITRLIDDRYSGIAKGVGTAKILGRIHQVTVKIGDAELPCALTVLDGKESMDMLLGLDMLKRYQASIDLKQNRLILQGSVSVPFLGESDIPKKLVDAMTGEPTIPGPAGTVIGGRSGAVKPAPSGAAPPSRGFQGQGRALAPAAPSQSSASNPSTTAPRAVPAARPSTTEYPEDTVRSLIAIGASREEAIEALRACGGNAEYAASLLFSNI